MLNVDTRIVAGTDKPCTHPKRIATGLDDDGATTYQCTYCGERL